MWARSGHRRRTTTAAALRLAHRLVHPIHLLDKLAIEPAEAAGHLALLRDALAPERGDVPQRVVRDVAREADQRARRGRPVREGRAVRADDALRELGHDGVRQALGAPLPDVGAAVGGRGDAPRAAAGRQDARGETQRQCCWKADVMDGQQGHLCVCDGWLAGVSQSRIREHSARDSLSNGTPDYFPEPTLGLFACSLLIIC